MLTYVSYKGRNYRCFDLDDHTTTSINSVRRHIAAALEIPELSSQDIVEIKVDNDEYVVLNNYYLAKKNPWKSCADAELLFLATKEITLRIVPSSESQSNTQPAVISAIQSVYESGNSDHTTASTTSQVQQTLWDISKDVENPDIFNAITTTNYANDNLQFSNEFNEWFDIEQLRFNAQFSSEPLKWIYNVASHQRLQYPSDDNLVLMQTIKADAVKTKPMRPILEIPTDHAKLIYAGELVELVSFVLQTNNSHAKPPDYYLAPYRGFWSIDKNNRSEKNPSFSNPFISPILPGSLPGQLNKVETGTGDVSYQLELQLCLMYAVDTKYDISPEPLIPYHDPFKLSQARPVPSFYCNLGHSRKKVNSNEYYICCALRSDPQSDLLDINTACVPEAFTVERRPPGAP